jgi:hypothetical protein
MSARSWHAPAYIALALIYGSVAVWYAMRHEWWPAMGWMMGAVQPAITASLALRARSRPDDP